MMEQNIIESTKYGNRAYLSNLTNSPGNLSNEINVSLARSTFHISLICIATTALSVLTIGGNFLVILSFVRFKHLRTLSNVFICSLAFSDIMIGIFSTNFYAAYVIKQSWPLGVVLCDVWLVVDYVCCQASVFHLLIICFDRYLSLTKPLTYRSKRTASKVYLAIFLAWLIAFVQWAPWIVSYPYLIGERTVAKGDCYIQFLYESWYTSILTAIPAYYLPVPIMCILYARIYFIVKKREDEVAKLTNSVLLKRRFVESESTLSNVNMGRKRNNVKEHVATVSLKKEVQNIKDEMQKKKMFVIRQKKAAKLLITILLAYILTWLPYNIFAVYAPFCPTCINADLWDFAYGLCYLNSTLNPLCYAFGCIEFRRAFVKLLCHKKYKDKSVSLTIPKGNKNCRSVRSDVADDKVTIISCSVADKKSMCQRNGKTKVLHQLDDINILEI